MKFLIAGFYHESNTFNPILTKKEDFIERNSLTTFRELCLHSERRGRK